MRLTRLAAACTLASTLGCATAVNGPHQAVAIESEPQGALALVLPVEQTVRTPAEIELQRKLAHTVIFALEGYCPKVAHLDRVASNWILGNILIGGMVGISADAENGSAFRLTPDPLRVELSPLDDSCRPPVGFDPGGADSSDDQEVHP